jgi:hypothetical protein
METWEEVVALWKATFCGTVSAKQSRLPHERIFVEEEEVAYRRRC